MQDTQTLLQYWKWWRKNHWDYQSLQRSGCWFKANNPRVPQPICMFHLASRCLRRCRTPFSRIWGQAHRWVEYWKYSCRKTVAFTLFSRWPFQSRCNNSVCLFFRSRANFFMFPTWQWSGILSIECCCQSNKCWNPRNIHTQIHTSSRRIFRKIAR